MSEITQIDLTGYATDPCPTCDTTPSHIEVETEVGQYIDFMKVHPNWRTTYLLPCEHRIGQYTIHYVPASATGHPKYVSYKTLEHVNLLENIKVRKRMLS